MLEPVITISKQIVSSRILASATTEISTGVNELINNSITTTEKGTDAFASIVSKVANLAVPVSIVALVILMSYGAFTMVTSQGNPEKINEAKEIISNALIGFVVVVGAVAILIALNGLLGLGITN
jgi:hypothetical protein